ncbi:MAG: iron-containing alcohol dehydrogenase [Salinarimonas sp.]|nr:iron-containing alcohol dehydrogenase [Salinarimonas sp.]
MQRRFIGPGAIAGLPAAVRSLAHPGRYVLVVAGDRSFDACGGADIVDALPGPVRVLRSSGDLPRIEELARLYRACGDVEIGCVVAVGGGRVIDLAKLLACALAAAGDPIDPATGIDPRLEGRVPLIAVATTAGSGSESTPFAVCYVAGRKTSLDRGFLLPDVAIVDPALLASLPPQTMACAGLDALCQSIEALLSRHAAPASDTRAARALVLVARSLRAAPRGDPRARARLARGASEAGRAIALTRTTIPHALSYPLSVRHGIAHGHAVALSMARYLERFGEALAADAALAPWRRSYARVLAALGARDPHQAASIWRSLLDDLGLAPTASACGLHRSDIARLVEEYDPDRFANAPLSLEANEIPGLFE